MVIAGFDPDLLRSQRIGELRFPKLQVLVPRLAGAAPDAEKALAPVARKPMQDMSTRSVDDLLQAVALPARLMAEIVVIRRNHTSPWKPVHRAINSRPNQVPVPRRLSSFFCHVFPAGT